MIIRFYFLFWGHLLTLPRTPDVNLSIARFTDSTGPQDQPWSGDETGLPFVKALNPKKSYSLIMEMLLRRKLEKRSEQAEKYAEALIVFALCAAAVSVLWRHR